MTKTCPNTKENLQKQEKTSRQGPRCQKTRKCPKSEEIEHSIAARCLPSCHDGSCLFLKKTEEINLKKIFHRSTMKLLGTQADEMHRISYKIELNLHIAVRWLHRSAMSC
ncbi:hypothetical protein QL285_055803 [Trifolium repens]|nr:hypothetical protein QL285_055803 [Trifolium repens]